VAVTLLAVATVSAVITLLIEAGYVIALVDEPGGRPHDPDLDQPFAAIAPVTALGGLILGGLGVLSFVFWFGGAYGALARSGVMALRFGEWCAYGCWFVPLAGFVVPKLLVDDLWRASGPNRGARGSAGARPPIPLWLHLWWVVAALSPPAWLVLFSLPEGDDVAGARTASVRFTIGLLLVAAAGAGTVALIRSLTARLERQAAIGPELSRHPGDR
jgi:hypothetical protein